SYTQMELTALAGCTVAARAAGVVPTASEAEVSTWLQPIVRDAASGVGLKLTVVSDMAVAPVCSPTKFAVMMAVPAEPPPSSCAVTLWQAATLTGAGVIGTPATALQCTE